MKRVFTNWSFLLCVMLMGGAAVAQQDWPKTISAANGNLIKIYQPQPESYANNTLKSRAAISIVESGKTDPVFGTWWFTAQAPGNGNTVTIQSLQVTDIRFPSDMDDSKIDDIKNTLQNEVPKMNVQLSQRDLQNALTLNQEQAKLSSTISTTPPKVIYSNKPSMLVLIDGTPKLQMNSDWGVEAVVNSPFTIVKNTDGRFYLYGGKRWFTAPDATGPYTYIPSAPGNLQKVQDAVDKANADNASASAKADADNGDGNVPDQSATVDNNVIPQIIVSTEPTELIQSNGEANFAPVEGTSLLYVKNSSNDIFMNVGSQEYFVLLAGRWYKANNLKGNWQYVAADQLPADFAKIPEGSPKDDVLASVAGTDAANDAVMDAQVPQTAKVDRKTATTDVTYDGNPEFENIQGTDMQYSANSSNSVLQYRGRYYTVDNGVWFESAGPSGPWTVATSRPDEVDLIPPSSPAYNMKYVYVYDVSPDYVWMGYTPGYLNTYIYGPTIVYGTGYYYRPWYRHYYYPRAYTWGFNMCYNPWYGWNVGWDFSFGWNWGWFNIGIGGGRWNYYHSGWWGPVAYRPIVRYNPYRGYGYYGARARNYYYNNRTVVVNRTVNVYNNRRGVVTVNNRRAIETRAYNRTANNNYRHNNNNGFNNRGRFNNSNGYNNRVADGARPNNGYNNRSYNNNNRAITPNNNNNRTYPGNNTPNRAYSRPQSPGNTNPGYNNRQTSPGYQRPNNNLPNRVQPSQPQQQYTRPQPQQAPQQQYTRPQPQRSYTPPQQSAPRQVQPQRSSPTPQRSFERPTPSNNGGGGGRSSGGGGDHGGGGRSGHGRGR